MLRLALLLLPLLAHAADIRFIEHFLSATGNDRVAGGTIHQSTLVTWGDRLLRRSLPHGGLQVLRGNGRGFSEGGCLSDVDRDGRPDVVVCEPPDLVWFQAPHWTRHQIARNVDAADLIPATLLGHRGVLLIHRRMQVRFYEIPADPAQPWPGRDLYSVYTPSWQGGLKLADIDDDGRTDILCGNYWIRSPEKWELPWRLFAINTWTEHERSGMMRVIYDGVRLLAAQREMAPARLAWFSKPRDPTQLWPEQRIDDQFALDHPRGLDLADFDGDGHSDILVGEGGGQGRLLLLAAAGPVQVISRGAPIVFAQAADLNGDGRPDIVVVRRGSISYWENAGPRR